MYDEAGIWKDDEYKQGSGTALPGLDVQNAITSYGNARDAKRRKAQGELEVLMKLLGNRGVVAGAGGAGPAFEEAGMPREDMQTAYQHEPGEEMKVALGGMSDQDLLDPDKVAAVTARTTGKPEPIFEAGKLGVLKKGQESESAYRAASTAEATRHNTAEEGLTGQSLSQAAAHQAAEAAHMKAMEGLEGKRINMEAMHYSNEANARSAMNLMQVRRWDIEDLDKAENTLRRDEDELAALEQKRGTTGQVGNLGLNAAIKDRKERIANMEPRVRAERARLHPESEKKVVEAEEAVKPKEVQGPLAPKAAPPAAAPPAAAEKPKKAALAPDGRNVVEKVVGGLKNAAGATDKALSAAGSLGTQTPGIVSKVLYADLTPAEREIIARFEAGKITREEARAERALLGAE